MVRFSGIMIVLLFPVLATANTSNSLMDVSSDGKLLLVANTDSGTVTVIDTRARKVLHEIHVGKKPEGVTWIGDSHRAAVTVFGDGAVVLVDAKTGKVLERQKVTAEPYGIVGDAAGKTLWVTHDYPGKVSELDAKTLKTKREMDAGAFVRGLALAPDESRIYVTEFFTGILRAIDLKSGKEVDSWKGHSTDNLCRNVFVHHKRPKAYLPHIRSMVNVIHGAGSIFPQLSICDLKPGEGRRRSSIAMDTFNGVYVVANPWEVVLSPDSRKLYVIYAGTNDMNLCEVIDDDYREIKSLNIARLGKNPRAVRTSPDGKEVYVYHALDFNLGIYDENMRPLAKVTTCAPPLTPEWVQGKILFNSALPPMTSRRWIACFSCHPDGLNDGRVWQNPEGLRKTTALFGMAHTHPLHYSADRDEAQDFEYTIRSLLMQGRGLSSRNLKPKNEYHKIELEQKTSGMSKDLDALAIYCNSFDVPLSPHIPAPGKLSPAAQRGKSLFFRKDVGCASCHSGPYYTDSTLTKPYKLHDVGTGKNDPGEKMGPLYDTPTLLGVYRTAPYLHHGKAKTLRDVLTTANPGDKHGKTSQLSPQEIDDMVEFLKSLPYDHPPTVTPNTVQYRVILDKSKK